jgi:flagellar biogenesis protein FliO
VSDGLQQALSITLVLALLATLWLLRRNGIAVGRLLRPGQGKPNPIRSEARLALTQNHCLHLVETGSGRILVATHPQGIAWMTLTGRFEEAFGSALSAEEGRGK